MSDDNRPLRVQKFACYVPISDDDSTQTPRLTRQQRMRLRLSEAVWATRERIAARILPYDLPED